MKTQMKNFKKSILAFTVLATLAGCEFSTSSSAKPGANPQGSTPEVRSDNEGGISAGGGGTLPSDPIQVYKVVEIVSDAKRELRLVFNNVRKYGFRYDGDRQERYYFGKDNLATQLEKTDIEILQDQPCKDKFGHEVDASVYASRANTICISAFRIAPKLVEETANKEILALLIHELSHLLGASESEAVRLQQDAVYPLRTITTKDVDGLQKATYEVATDLEALYDVKGVLKNAVIASDLEKIDTTLTSLADKLYGYDNGFDALPFSYIDYTQRDYQYVLEARLQLASYYVRSLTNEKGSDWFKTEYEKCFAGHSEVKLKDLKDCLVHVDIDNIYGEATIPKLTSLSELNHYMSDVFLYVSELGTQVRAISFDQPLPYFHLPSNAGQTNPWEKFMGNYKAELIDCDGSSNLPNGLTEIEISNDIINYPIENLKIAKLKESTATGWAEFGICNGSCGNYPMILAGDDRSAVATTEQGTRWYDRQNHGWNKSTKTIEQKEDQLIFKTARESFRYSFNGVEQSASSCQYKLVRK